MRCDPVTEAMGLYSDTSKRKGLCVERVWSADGETELARHPYTRVRFTRTFDTLAFLERREWVPVGLTVEVW